MMLVSTLLLVSPLQAVAFVPLLLATTNRLPYSPGFSTQIFQSKDPKHVVVVGGGWAGFSAADALAKHVNVTLLDASPGGKGGLASGWRTSRGRPVEAGIHGFWREYKNTFSVLERLGLDADKILSPFSPSILHSKNGQVAVAPVLKNDNQTTEELTPILSSLALASLLQSALSPSNSMKPPNVLQPVAALLPAPLDLAILAKYNSGNPLTLADRASALGLLGIWADFGQEDDVSWQRYDAISAEDLFLKKAGISNVLYDEVVNPLLHVLPMCPGYDCSAAAALSCFHVFALQSQGAFDVRWCRASIAESIFKPWENRLIDSGVRIQGDCKVASICQNEDRNGLQIRIENDSNEALACDAVVMAIGGVAMGRLGPASPAFENISITSDFPKNRGVTCVAVRMFLKPHTVVTCGLAGGQYDATLLPSDVAEAMKESPVVVCGAEIGNIPELKETGFCIYDLQRLHDEFAVENQRESAVLEVDFFRADDIADIQDDEQVAKLALQAVAATFKTVPISSNNIIDVAVVRARNAVSHFVTKSASYSPPVRLSKERGIYMAGDWIDRSGHASWSTEKAVVTGRQSAQAVLEDFGLLSQSRQVSVIPAAPDTPALEALRRGAQILRSLVPPPGDGVPQSPWNFLESVVENGLAPR